MRRVLFVAEELSSNGAMKSLIALLKALDPKVYAVSLFLFRHNENTLSTQIPEYVEVLPELCPYKVLRMPLKQALSDSLKRGRIDMALLRSLVAWQRYRHSDFKLWPFLPELPGEYDLACSYADGFVAPLILKKVKARKTACWIHFMYSMIPQLKYVYDALKHCSVCVPVSVEAGKDLERVLGCNVNKHVIHNITDSTECNILADKSNDFPRRSNIVRIVSVGRVTSAKRFEIIPDTALILKEKGIQFEWFIAGNGDIINEIQNKVSVLNLEEEVQFVGELDNPMPLVKSADIFVNPSLHESWGMTVSEALCLGKVVIASDLPVFAEQIEDGVNGFMREANPSIIARTICEILSDSNLRKNIEKNALKYPFTKDMIVKEFDRLMESLFYN